MVRYHIRSTTPDKRRRSSRGARLREQPYKRSPGRSSQGAKAPSIETARVRELNGQGLTEIAKAQAKRYYGGEGKASEPPSLAKKVKLPQHSATENDFRDDGRSLGTARKATLRQVLPRYAWACLRSSRPIGARSSQLEASPRRRRPASRPFMLLFGKALIREPLCQ
jgi:hypothetical protein